MRRFLFLMALGGLLSSTIFASPPQPADSSKLKKLIGYTADLALQAAVTDYVYDQFLDYGDGKIGEEKFLISLMELVNREMAARLQSPKAARQQYFKALEGMLDELGKFNKRLHTAGIHELDDFTSNLNEGIKLTVKAGVVDFKKKKIFENALQMLYVSEEMIKMDQFQSNTDISQKIQQSENELLAAFGKQDNGSSVSFGKKPNIYDLFVAWKKNEKVHYELQLVDVKLIRVRLLKESSDDERLRMFNKQLDLAYTMFNYNDYDLAERLLGDLLETYPEWGFQELDDLLFYRAESNFAMERLIHARQQYEALITKYPGTTYLPKAYNRLVQINYEFGNYSKVVEYATLNQNLLSTTDPQYYDIQFLSAMAYYDQGDYDKTVEILQNIPTENPYYHLAQYFIGNAYIDGQLTDQAMQAYAGIVADNSAPAELRDRSLYKLGLIQHEQGNYLSAIDYLNQVSLTFSQYDRILNAFAWSFFEIERSKPIGEKRDFSQAQLYANRLITEYYASPYKMEATGLLAYINQIQNAPTQAINLYREVYEEKQKYGTIGDYLSERKRLEALYRNALTVKENAIKSDNIETYTKASKLVDQLREEIDGLDLSESSRSGISMYQEANSVIRQMKELNRLRLMATEAKNQKALERIDSLEYRLAAVLESFPKEAFDAKGNVNYFDDFPVGTYVAEEKYRYQQTLDRRNEVNAEIDAVDNLLKKIDDRIALAKVSRNFEKVAMLEAKRRDVEELKKQYDHLYVALTKTEVNPNPYSEFNRWGDIGAFGIINVYFDQKRAMQGQLAQVSGVFNRVNEELDSRKQEVEDKIKKIEAQIRFMTMKARMEERTRLRAERERAFKESYFDTRESEAGEEEN